MRAETFPKSGYGCRLLQRPDRDMRPAQPIEIQKHRLSVLQLMDIRPAALTLHRLDPERCGHQHRLCIGSGGGNALQKGGIGDAAADHRCGGIRRDHQCHRTLDRLSHDRRRKSRIRIIHHALSDAGNVSRWRAEIRRL